MNSWVAGWRSRRLGTVFLCVWTAVLFGPVAGQAAEEAEAKSRRPASPLGAVASLSQFRLHPKFRLELAASEPQVIDPVAMRFDENGRMWVVEMGDYPNGPAAGERPLSRVRWLEDTDGDGRYETSRVFADGLLFATGIQPWAGGILVTAAGELLYLADTDGDGVADVRQTWYAGFKQENPQLRANHPTFALDNRIYVANGLRGGVVAAKRKEWAGKSKPVAISGRDFRFNPLTGVCEAVNGNGQFGLTFDDLGRRFVCSNRNPCRHVVLSGDYLSANPRLAVPEVMHDVVTAGAASRIFPISKIWVTSNLHEGQFTAACGVTVYRGALLGEGIQGNVFTCDPTGNLVHREVVSPSGATLVGKPGRHKVEFLASRDEWFRPVNLEVGPGGALYVVDMYRAVVEHPQWVPVELKNRPDNYSGNDRGRIYRVVPVGHTVADRDEVAPGLGRVAGAQLVEELKSSNGWRRDTAARLIYQKQDRSVVDDLQRLASDQDEVIGRIHALWALDGLGGLGPETVGLALASRESRVVVQALRLCEPHLASHPELLDKVDRRQLENPAVRFQWLMSQVRHPGWAEAKTAVPLVERAVAVSLSAPCDSWTRTALIAGCGRHGLLLLSQLVDAASQKADVRFGELRDWVSRISETIGRGGDAREVAGLLDVLDPERPIGKLPGWSSVQLSGLVGLDTGLRSRGQSLGAPPGSVSRKRLAIAWRAVVGWSARPPVPGMRSAATRLLRSGPEDVAVPALLLRFESGDLVALESLTSFKGHEIGSRVLESYAGLTAAGRRVALDVLIADSGRTALLLDAIVQGTVPRADLDPTRVGRLRRHAEPGIRKRAVSVLADLVPKARRVVLERYRASLGRDGDPRRGREVFRKNCTACHRVDRLGVDVAPDISDSRRWSREQLLLSILDPNRAVDSNYFSYSVVTSSGVVHTGLVASETPTAVSLRQPEGKIVSVLRSNIEVLKSNGVSLMPEGLEKNVSRGQMADLLSFLKNWRYLDGRIPVKRGRGAQ